MDQVKKFWSKVWTKFVSSAVNLIKTDAKTALFKIFAVDWKPRVVHAFPKASEKGLQMMLQMRYRTLNADRLMKYEVSLYRILMFKRNNFDLAATIEEIKTVYPKITKTGLKRLVKQRWEMQKARHEGEKINNNAVFVG